MESTESGFALYKGSSIDAIDEPMNISVVASGFWVKENRIYYIGGGSKNELRAVNLDGTNDTLLFSASVWDFLVSGDEIIWIDKQTGFEKSFSSVEIFNDNRTMFDTFFPSVKETDNSEPYRIRADGSSIESPSPEAFIYSGPFGSLPTQNEYRCASDASGNMGVLNKEQQWVVEPKYGHVYQTSSGQIRIVDGNDVGFFDTETEKVVFVEDAVDIDDFEEGYASVALISNDPSRVEGPLYNFIDEEGNCLLQKSLAGTKPQLSEGIITFKEDGLYGFMDMGGNILVPPSYI